MNTIIIDPDKCKKDGICIASCPFLLLHEGENKIPVLADGAEATCINCGHCLTVCPGKAISLNGIAADGCETVDPRLSVSPEQAVQLFRSRRSIRAYKDKLVERETVQNLIDMARWAPSARNVQPVHWLVVDSSKQVNLLAGMVIDWFRANNALPDIVKTFESGNDIIHRGAPCLLIAHAASNGFRPAEDCSIAVAAIETVAPTFGLGCCWAGFFMGAATKHEPILEYLSLPQGHQVYGALMIGHPKFRYTRIPPRTEAKIEWRTDPIH